MKKILFLLVAATTLLVGCSKTEPELKPEATILTVKAKRSDGKTFKDTYAYIWDASNNDLNYDLNSTMSIEIKDKSGKRVSPIRTEEMFLSTSNSGVVSDYKYCILNVDDMLSYDKSKSGKLLIAVVTDFGYSTSRPKYSFIELEWNREKEYTLEKIFKDDNILAFYEKW